jgi:hypothetical protein
MKSLIMVAMLFVAAESAVAQAPCTLQSCRSFHELLSRKDADIMNAIKTDDQQVFVCFRSKDDSFFIVSNLIIPNRWWVEDQQMQPASQPPTSPQRSGNVDYDALAKQAGAVDPSEIKTPETFDSEKQSGPFLEVEYPYRRTRTGSLTNYSLPLRAGAHGDTESTGNL